MTNEETIGELGRKLDSHIQDSKKFVTRETYEIDCRYRDSRIAKLEESRQRVISHLITGAMLPVIVYFIIQVIQNKIG